MSLYHSKDGNNSYLWSGKFERNETLHIHVKHGKLLQRVQYYISKSPTMAKLLNAMSARSKSTVNSSQCHQTWRSTRHTILQCDKLTMWRVDWFPLKKRIICYWFFFPRNRPAKFHASCVRLAHFRSTRAFLLTQKLSHSFFTVQLHIIFMPGFLFLQEINNKLQLLLLLLLGSQCRHYATCRLPLHHRVEVGVASAAPVRRHRQCPKFPVSRCMLDPENPPLQSNSMSLAITQPKL